MSRKATQSKPSKTRVVPDQELTRKERDDLVRLYRKVFCASYPDMMTQDAEGLALEVIFNAGRKAERESGLLPRILEMAKACVHGDNACQLVFYINNETGADAKWRSWRCKTHNYSGDGAVPQCPECRKAGSNA